MKEFNFNTLRKFVALMFFFGFMLFSSASFAQSAQKIQESINILTERKAKLETIRNDTYSPNDPKYGFYTDVMNHIQSGIDLMKSGNYLSIPENFMTDDVWKKIDPTVLQEYSTSDLNLFNQNRAQMISEGRQNTLRYLKLDLILKANGM